MEALQSTKRHFSKLGLMYFLGTLIIVAIQYLEYFLLETFCPRIFENYTAYFLIMMLTMYAVSMPLMALLIRTVPSLPAPEKKKMSVGQWIAAFLISFAGMYVANIVGNVITSIISTIKGSAVSNDILTIATSNNIWANVLVMVILAPIAEELLFRKLLIDRTVKYGEGISVFLSALFFGLFHGNLNQFAYAFVIGGIFAFVYVKTGNIKYTIFMHMLINFIGSILSVLMLNLSGISEFLYSTDISDEQLVQSMMDHLPGMLAYLFYALILLVMMIVGIVLFLVNLKKIRFSKTELSVPKGKRFVTYFINVGMLLFTVYWIIQIIVQLLS